jgi:AcrR family transcriptional regulator
MDAVHETPPLRASLSRRDRKKERTRDEIYRAAINLFLRRGFDSVTIEEICDAADVARATFFLHFPAKEALLTEYGARTNQELADLIRNHRGGATSTLRTALKSLADRALRHPDVVRMLAREVLSRPNILLREHQEQTENLVSLIGAVIARGQAAGEFRRRIDPALAAVALCATYFALIYEWTRRVGRLDVEGAIAQALDLVLNGLSERKSRRSSN